MAKNTLKAKRPLLHRLAFDEYKSIAEDLENRLEPKFEVIRSEIKGLKDQIEGLKDQIKMITWLIPIIITLIMGIFTALNMIIR